MPILIRALIMLMMTSAFLCAGTSAHAQLADYKTRMYNDLIRDIITNPKTDLYKYQRLRRYYSESSLYQPDATKVIEQMNAIAPHVNPDRLSTKEQISAFDAFRQLMLQHLGNIDVMNNTALLSQMHKHLNPTNSMNVIIAGLIGSFQLDGDGKSFTTPYKIYTVGEEIALLKYLGATVKGKSHAVKNGRHYAIYNATIDDADQQIYAEITNMVSAFAEDLEQEEAEDKKLENAVPTKQ